MCPCAKCEPAIASTPFPGFRFIALEPGSWPGLDVFMRAHPHSLSGYTLSCLAAWDPVFNYRWVFPEPETLLISHRLPPDGRCHLLQPMGVFSPAVRHSLLRAASQLSYPLRIVGVDRAFALAYPDFISHFDVKPDRDNDNYIYRAEDLALLGGRRYSKKRNLLAQAERAYARSVEPLSLFNAEACLEVLNTLKTGMEGIPSKNLEQDDCAVESAVRLFAGLSLEGTLIRVNGEPAGFSIFERQSADTAVVHFERALRRYKGLHQVVNQATARVILEKGYTFINREEDLGDPGLRQAKESYYPVRMAEALLLTYKG